MRIPADFVERAVLYDDIIRSCMSSQEDRRASYMNYRMYWLFGTGPESLPNATYNYIYPLIDQLTAFVFSGDTTRFSTDFHPDTSPDEHVKGPPTARAVSAEWLRSSGDLNFDQATVLGHVYGCELIKLRPKVWAGGEKCQIEPFCVDPGDFGVLREDEMSLDKQEAFVQEYTITVSNLVNELKEGGHPDVELVERQVQAFRRGGNQGVSAGLDRIITSASQPIVQGNLDFSLNVVDKYKARVSEPTAKMFELYVYDNAINDYRVVTIADPAMVIWDRPIRRTWVEREHPFIPVVPTPMHGYFFGTSEVERLMGLQQMLNDRVGQIQHLLNLHAYAPKSFSGFAGITDEMAYALDSPGGYVQSDIPTAQVQNQSPKLPEDLYTEANRIIQMMEETAGISNVMQGKGETGVRSTGHASQLLRVGASRVKKRANRVGDALEEMATKYLQGLRRYSKMKLQEERKDGIVFPISGVPESAVMKVDAHSNSPLFVEDATQKLFDMVKLGAIDLAELVDLLEVPERQYLRWKLENVIEPARQAQAAQEAQARQAAQAPRRVA